MVGSSSYHVNWLCWCNNLLYSLHLVDSITASSHLVYFLLLDISHCHLSDLISISGFSVSLFPMVACLPFFLGVHETYFLGGVFVNIGLTRSSTMLARLLLCRQFLLASIQFLNGGFSFFHCMVHVRLEYGGDGCSVVAGCVRVVTVVARFYFRWRVVVKAWSGFESCK